MGAITIGREPARIDVDVIVGEPVDFTVPVLDSAGAPQTPTGWTLTAAITTGRGTTPLGSFTLTAVTGGVRVTAAAADTADWSGWGVPAAQWALWVTPPSGQPEAIAAGWVRPTTH